MKCSKCGLQPATPATPAKAPVKAPRLPRGWKRKAECTYCPVCWAGMYVIRAITIPVVKPLGDGIGWKQLREALSEAWRDSTACANWMSGELYARDIRRKPGSAIKEKMPAMPKIYLYPEAVKKFPDVPSGAIASMEQVIGRKYRARRYQLIWTNELANSNFKYPYPAAFPGQVWTPKFAGAGDGENADKLPCVAITMRRGKKFLLQLRGGSEWRRQLAAFKLLVSGEALQGELVFYRQRVGGNENRNGVVDRDSGGQHVQYRVMCKMVGWFVRTLHDGLTGALHVRTDADAMLVALRENEEKIWWLNADHVKRWQSEHKRRLHRFAEDQKHENRPIASFASLRERVSATNRNRLDSFVKQSAAQCIGVALRGKYAEMRYDDTVREYCADFPWAALKLRLQAKCEEAGIKFSCASGEVATVTLDTAREEVNA